MPGKKGPDDMQRQQHSETEFKILATLAKVTRVGGAGFSAGHGYRQESWDISYHIQRPYFDKGVRKIAREASISPPVALEYLRDLKKQGFVTQLGDAKWTANPRYLSRRSQS